VPCNQWVQDLAPSGSLLGWSVLSYGNRDCPVSSSLFWTCPSLGCQRWAGSTRLSRESQARQGVVPTGCSQPLSNEGVAPALQESSLLPEPGWAGVLVAGEESRERSRDLRASQGGTRGTPAAACGSCSGSDVCPWLTLGVISLQLLHVGLLNSLRQALRRQLSPRATKRPRQPVDKQTLCFAEGCKSKSSSSEQEGFPTTAA